MKLSTSRPAAAAAEKDKCYGKEDRQVREQLLGLASTPVKAQFSRLDRNSLRSSPKMDPNPPLKGHEYDTRPDFCHARAQLSPEWDPRDLRLYVRTQFGAGTLNCDIFSQAIGVSEPTEVRNQGPKCQLRGKMNDVKYDAERSNSGKSQFRGKMNDVNYDAERSNSNSGQGKKGLCVSRSESSAVGKVRLENMVRDEYTTVPKNLSLKNSSTRAQSNGAKNSSTVASKIPSCKDDEKHGESPDIHRSSVREKKLNGLDLIKKAPNWIILSDNDSNSHDHNDRVDVRDKVPLPEQKLPVRQPSHKNQSPQKLAAQAQGFKKVDSFEKLRPIFENCPPSVNDFEDVIGFFVHEAPAYIKRYCFSDPVCIRYATKLMFRDRASLKSEIRDIITEAPNLELESKQNDMFKKLVKLVFPDALCVRSMRDFDRRFFVDYFVTLMKRVEFEYGEPLSDAVTFKAAYKMLLESEVLTKKEREYCMKSYSDFTQKSCLTKEEIIDFLMTIGRTFEFVASLQRSPAAKASESSRKPRKHSDNNCKNKHRKSKRSRKKAVPNKKPESLLCF